MALGDAWHEGYMTALIDFEVAVTDEGISRSTKNPHSCRPLDRDDLTAYEKHEIRNALGYHFDPFGPPADCRDDYDLQAEILETIVLRILARRPARGA